MIFQLATEVINEASTIILHHFCRAIRIFAGMAGETLHETFMRRCLELAANGLGHVSPNPMVGCVIVHDGRIIGEGFHRKYGETHAEVNALNNVVERQFLKDSTLYVNLEPCSHHGKTPPCTDRIISEGIPRVVIACSDPNPLVAGKGLQKLRMAGIQVTEGILQDDTRELNRRFMTFQLKKRPYIILKWAQSSDGYIDYPRKRGDGKKPEWITSLKLRPLVHKWRTEESAIMVGTRTALLDDPMLTAREWKGRNPLRVVIDRKCSLPPHLNITDGSAPTLILNETQNGLRDNIEYLQLDFSCDIIEPLLQHLHARQVQSLIVEGGLTLLDSFIRLNLWDEARVFTGVKEFRQGVQCPDFPFSPVSEMAMGNDLLCLYMNI